MLDRAQSALHESEPLYQHGVPHLLPRLATPQLVVRWCGGREPGGDFTFTGQAFSDGALIGPRPAAARRAGWACVLVDDAGAIIGGLYGTCPDRYPTSLRAELWGVVQLLPLASLPLWGLKMRHISALQQYSVTAIPPACRLNRS